MTIDAPPLKAEATTARSGAADPSPPAADGTWVDRVWVMRLLLVVVALACLVPGQMTLPPTDRDESRYVQATKQMIASGDYVDIRFQEAPRYKKPVGIYWMQSGAVLAYGEITGNRDPAATPLWVYRLPSVAGGALAVLFAHAAGMVLFGARTGLIAGLLTAATIMVGMEANIAKTDAVLLAAIVAAQAMLARWWMAEKQPGRWTAHAFWIAMGIGVIVKGPIILMVVGLTVLWLLVFTRRVKWLGAALRPVAFLLGLAIAVPWYVLIYHKAGTAFFEHSIGTDLLGKVAQARESHGAPPGAYVLAAFGTLWPVVAFVPETIGWARRRLADRAVMFCIAWIAPTWIAFEAFRTKLPHYVLPTYPAFAILVAAAFVMGAGYTTTKWRRIARLPLLVGPMVLFVLIGVAGRMLGGAVPWLGLACIGAAWIICVGLWLSARKQGVGIFSSSALALSTALMFAGALQFTAPGLSRVWISNAIAEKVEVAAGCPAPRIVTIGYNEPSLVFLSRGDVVTAAPSGAAAVAERVPCQLLVVDQAFEPAVIDQFKAADFQLSLEDRVEGLNYNGGDELNLGLYRIEPASR